MLKIIAIPILLTLIASGCDASRIALKLNRTHHLLDVLPITHTDRTEKTKIICLEEPDHKEYAKTARYIVHKSDWTALGTISSLPKIKGYPMVNVVSVADSKIGSKSTGDVYFYVLKVDPMFADLKYANKITALFSNEQDLACSKRGLDAMEPTCSRVMMTGYVAQLPINSTEFIRATDAFASRHPSISRWLDVHKAVLCKIEIVQVTVLDTYGGPHFVTVDDYYNANYDNEY